MADAINSEFAFEIRAKVSKPLEFGAGRNGSEGGIPDYRWQCFRPKV